MGIHNSTSAAVRNPVSSIKMNSKNRVSSVILHRNSSIKMESTTSDSATSHFNQLPDEILEKIFFMMNDHISLTPDNHVNLECNSYYFDYSVQQPLLKKSHIDLHHVALVCRRFYKIIKSPNFWEQKCRQEHVLLPNQHLPIDFIAYEKLYVNNPFHPSFNLIEEKNWKKSRNTNSQIEPVPCGSKRLYDEFNRLSPCRVTSYTLAEFFQSDIPLPSKGPESSDLIDLCPIIEFSICIAARWDCGSRCSISLSFSDGHHWKYERTFPQWTDEKWHRIIYRYAEYEQFPSEVTVSLAGRDTQYWAGYFGIKFGQARLHLVLRTSENGKNEESTMVIEPNPEHELLPCPNSNPLPDDLPISENASPILVPIYHS